MNYTHLLVIPNNSILHCFKSLESATRFLKARFGRAPNEMLGSGYALVNIDMTGHVVHVDDPSVLEGGLMLDACTCLCVDGKRRMYRGECWQDEEGWHFPRERRYTVCVARARGYAL